MINLAIVVGYVAFIVILGLKGRGQQEDAADVFRPAPRYFGRNQ